MLGLCCDKTYGTIKNQDDGDDDRDNFGNEYRKKNANAASGSGSNGLIFNPIATPWSRLGIVE